MKERLKLTLACTDSDHTRDFTRGDVEAEGIDITYLPLGIEEMFFRFTKYREWDVSEMSFAKYLALRSQGDESLIALPVFLSRVFRHSSIFIRRGGRIRKPEDLRGGRIGIPEWAQTAAIYSRGLLAHEYGVGLTDVHWVAGGVGVPGREEKVAVQLPPGVKLERVVDRSLDDLLAAGEIDALMTAHAPPSFERGDPNTVRLFEDYRAVESAYFRKTGIFPIMHLVAIRGPIVAEHPWVARSLYKAFEEAKRRSYLRLENTSVACFPVPWTTDVVAALKRDFGEDWWPYGTEPNHTTLDAFLRFAQEQGVTQRLMTADELFPETLRSTYTM
jgi:4,5-dihydroxyphthalate decarboxylase